MCARLYDRLALLGRTDLYLMLGHQSDLLSASDPPNEKDRQPPPARSVRGTGFLHLISPSPLAQQITLQIMLLEKISRSQRMQQQQAPLRFYVRACMSERVTQLSAGFSFLAVSDQETR